jgi:hypothetical protein
MRGGNRAWIHCPGASQARIIALDGVAAIGARSQIASGVQILSGARQHARTAAGLVGQAQEGLAKITQSARDTAKH